MFAIASENLVSAVSCEGHRDILLDERRQRLRVHREKGGDRLAVPAEDLGDNGEIFLSECQFVVLCSEEFSDDSCRLELDRAAFCLVADAECGKAIAVSRQTRYDRA